MFSPPQPWQTTMRYTAFILFGIAAVATAEAQSEPARLGFLPMPHRLPTLMFAPDPLAGTLLRPLPGPPVAGALPEVALEVVPAAVMEPEPTIDAATVAADADAADEAVSSASSEATTATVTDAATAEETVPEEKPTPGGSTVTVIVENVESGSGTVNVAMCDKGLSREGCPYVREVQAHAGFVETEFQDIPPGTYAVVGYHDVNGNDIFDKIFGMPREPYALSNNASDNLVPTFNDAALPIKSGENAVIIRLTKLGG
jgi:uncharacterized protein (DUF2141 family)